MAHLIAAGISSLFGTVSAAKKKVADGWGDSIRWLTLSDGKREAKERNRIMIAVIKHEGCMACDQLKTVFSRSEELQELAQSFVMVNVTAKEVGREKTFHPDGSYVPRILFFDPSGKLMAQVKRKSSRLNKWQYNYATEKQVLASMKNVLSDRKKESHIYKTT